MLGAAMLLFRCLLSNQKFLLAPLENKQAGSVSRPVELNQIRPARAIFSLRRFRM
jgi:hypothetical protein